MKTAEKVQSISPMAGQTMMGAEMIMEVLSEEGVDTLFGYSGGAILPTYDAVFKFNAKHAADPARQIKLVVPANEQGAGFMAAGYSRSSGRVGTFLVTSGPGATNCVTPIRDCMADSIPVVLICGQVPTHAIGSDAFQEAPIFNIMSSCAKHVFLVTKGEELEATIRTAYEIARSGRPGPVVIDVPKDVQNWKGTYQGHGTLAFRGYDKRTAKLDGSHISKDSAADFFDLLATSNRPLIYAGGGVINSNASAELRAFSEQFKIPVTTTLMGIGAADMKDPLCLHMLGMHGTASANYAVEDCDFLITVGARFDDRVAGKVATFAPNARHIAHIDIDAAEIGKVKGVHWSYIGEARTGLAELSKHGASFKRDFSAWHKHIAELKQTYGLNYDRASELIQPQYAVECLNAATKGEAIVSTGVGQHQMWAAQFCEFTGPRLWLTSGSMGTMGFGLPAAIGAAFANPNKIVVDIDGDGSIRMNLGELETVTTYDLSVKVLLLNNLGDGMVRQWQKTYYENRFSGTDKSLHRKVFIKAAEADGFRWAKRTADKAALAGIMKDFIEFDGPAFLEVMIDPDACVFPMVGPGMGYKEMITGDFMPARKVNQPEEKKEGEMPSLF